MKTMSISRRIAALVVLACCGTVLAAASTNAAATRDARRQVDGPVRGAVSGDFTIHWKQTGSRLHGHITLSRPSGTYSLGGSVKNGKIKFGAVSVGAKYKGTVRGTSMSGTWTSPQGGGNWSATKSSGGARPAHRCGRASVRPVPGPTDYQAGSRRAVRIKCRSVPRCTSCLERTRG